MVGTPYYISSVKFHKLPHTKREHELGSSSGNDASVASSSAANMPLWQRDINSVQRGQDRWKLYALSAQFSGEAEIAIKNKAHYHHRYKMARLELGQGLGYCYGSDMTQRGTCIGNMASSLWCYRGKWVMKRSASSVGSFVQELMLGGISGEA